MRLSSFVIAASVAVASPLFAQSVPQAVIADPPADAAHPPGLVALRYPSGGEMLAARLFTASGAGPHPIVLLLHGFPGTEMNYDLARAMQRAGWSVLAPEYRGVWGSGGKFSFSHTVEDARAALDFLSSADVRAKYAIDAKRVVIAGHSMGGFDTVLLAGDPRVAGAVTISAADIGVAFLAPSPKDAEQLKAGFADELSYTNITGDEMLADVAAHSAAWRFDASARRIGAKPVLVISSDDGLASHAARIVAGVNAAGGKATAVHFHTDHSYNDHRIALAGAIVGWLETRFPTP